MCPTLLSCAPCQRGHQPKMGGHHKKFFRRFAPEIVPVPLHFQIASGASARHCRKGAQPVPKAVHRSGCRDRHNWPRPRTPQSIMPSLNHCDLLRHMGVNNLPKVVTRQRRGRELNSPPASCKSNALATRLPSHPHQSSNRMRAVMSS